MELMGYIVEKNTDDTGKGGSCGFWLHGPRGARYGLIRNHRNPEMLFAWNDRKFGTVSVKGYGWFTDRDGTLTPVN